MSDQKLEKFAEVYANIRAVRAEHVPKLQQAEGEQEKTELQEEGQEAMKEAIRSNGIKVSEYDRVSRALNSDQELQQRFMQMVQQNQSGAQGSPAQPWQCRSPGGVAACSAPSRPLFRP